jgi:hypothetical protein
MLGKRNYFARKLLVSSLSKLGILEVKRDIKRDKFKARVSAEILSMRKFVFENLA